jgi:hypothetical protein
MCFRDVVPQTPPSLQLARPEEPDMSGNGLPVPVQRTSDNILNISARIDSGLRRLFRTPRNIFGLSRQYRSTTLPSHDPEEQVSLQDLSDVPVCVDPTEADELYYPFPNRSAFLLAEWHWNGGEQKSRTSFRNLTDIISNPEFLTTDIRDVNWDRINEALGTDDDMEWLDEDAGWIHTPVTLSVPYQSRRGVPSRPDADPQNYTVNDFRHRRLVSIIKEKISGLKDGHQFHFDPYELYWQRNDDADPVRTQGELYTSPAFLAAHQELQDSPEEPGCDLPRVVVALMFWSDATQLASFGNAKLWPLYTFFGNESKYHRCKPTCHLCEHVAYFQAVSWMTYLLAQSAH